MNNKRLEQIDLSIIGVIIFIFILLHSIYLLVTEKKILLNIKTISNESVIVQSLINRIVAFFIVLMFFTFALSNYYDILQSGSKDSINNQRLKLFVSSFALLSVTIEVYLTIKEFVSINNQKNTQN